MYTIPSIAAIKRTISYSCGDGSGTPPSSVSVNSGASFSPSANTCTAPNGYRITDCWTVSTGSSIILCTNESMRATQNIVLTAIYTSDTISLNWHDDEDELTGANVADSCTYGGTFNVPTPNERPGYVFTGWKVRTKTCLEITDQLTCRDTDGCIWNVTAVACKKYISDCHLLSQEECSNDYASGPGGGSNLSYCGWDTIKCCNGGADCR